MRERTKAYFDRLDDRELVPEVVCMIQKEVAERIAEGPGSKTYGILSVLLQILWRCLTGGYVQKTTAQLRCPLHKPQIVRNETDAEELVYELAGTVNGSFIDFQSAFRAIPNKKFCFQARRIDDRGTQGEDGRLPLP